MLKLPDVTVVLIDAVAHRMARAALEDTLCLIDPGYVLTFSDTMEVSAEGLRDRYGYTEILLKSAQEADACLWHRVWKQVPTSHILVIQWDGWVLDPNAWRNEFLEYDYIGAPWPWHSDRRVGNGGFSLRSRRLMQYLAEHAEEYPVVTPEDDTLCRSYRPYLEMAGFRWATEEVATQFSFERGPPRWTFGFHGASQFGKILSGDALRDRMSLAGPYERGKVEWRELETAI